MPYATLDQLYGNLDQLTKGEHDEELRDILDQATDIVNKALGFEFADYDAEASEQDVWSGNGGRWLYLPCHEAGSVAGVTQVASRGASSESETAITDYVVETRGRLYRDAEWLQRRWYRVTAKWGVGPAPDAIVRVTLEVATNMWNMRGNGSSSTAGVAGDGAVTYPRSLTWAQKSVIQGVKIKYWAAWHDNQG